MTLEEKKIKEVFDKYSHKDNGGEYMYYSHFLKAVTSICQQEIDEACKKAKIEENEYCISLFNDDLQNATIFQDEKLAFGLTYAKKIIANRIKELNAPSPELKEKL